MVAIHLTLKGLSVGKAHRYSPDVLPVDWETSRRREVYGLVVRLDLNIAHTVCLKVIQPRDFMITKTSSCGNVSFSATIKTVVGTDTKITQRNKI